MTTLRDDGSWADITYHPPASQDTRSVWPPLIHAERVLAMATCANTPSTWCASSGLLVGRAQRAFDYWLLSNLTNPDNWYQNRISNPIAVGKTCLLLDAVSPGGRVGSNVTEATQAVIARANWTQLPPGMTNVTGANLVWMATAHVYGGLTAGSEGQVVAATDRMWAELFVTAGNLAGLKEDNGFFQHCHGMGPTHAFIGPFGMLYGGGYGSGLTEFLLQWIGLTSGLTPFEMPPSSYHGFARLVLDGQEWMIPGSTSPHWDVSVMGRELARPGHHVPWDPALLATVGGARGAEFAQLARRLNHSRTTPLATGHRQFYRGDYAVHRESTWSAHVRTFSTRTINTECIAHENKLGKHLGAGATFLYQEGLEYSETYPLWNWKTLPGVTTELDGNTVCLENTSFPPTNTSCWIDCHNTQHTGRRAFVGGVTSGSNGFVAFDFASPFRYSSLAYRQVWLFCGDFYLILLKGLRRTSADLPVVTGLAQQRRSGATRVSGGAPLPLPDGNYTVPCSNGTWVHHGSVGYTVLGLAGGAAPTGSDRMRLTVSTGVETGNWSSIGFHTDAASLPMFRAFLAHPRAATPGDAAVVVQPSTPFGEFSPDAFLNRSVVDVVSNTGDVQAVLFQAQGLFGAALYTAGQMADMRSRPGGDAAWRFSVSSSMPCAVLVEQGVKPAGRITISVSDPGQASVSTVVTLQGLCLTGPGCGVCHRGPVPARHMTSLTVTFPQGTFAGDSVTLSCLRL